MYEFVRGELAAKDPSSAVIDAGGVGYRMQISTATFDALPGKGEAVKLLVHHTINADAGEMRLYGFGTAKERLIFRQLIEVQRVGPSLAIRILSSAGVDALIAAIAGGDALSLKKFKGVGPKMAERLVVELHEPLSKLGMLKDLGDGEVAAPGKASSNYTQNVADAIAALVNLGYKPAQAEKAASLAAKRLGADASTSDVIRAGLQQL